MARESRYDVLFEPVSIGPHVLRSRLIQPPQCTGAGTDHPGFQAAHRAIKAEGGYAAIFTELVGIAPGTDADPWTLPELWDDNDVANLSRMVEAVHEHGALAGVELGYHMHTAIPKSRQPGFGPTQNTTEWSPSPHGASHIELTPEDVPEVRRIHVDAALRALDAGFDLVTFHISHCTGLMHRFLIPHYNRRTDEYGGSFENRARLSREIMEDVREAVGDRCALGIRFTIDTLPAPLGLGEDGMSSDEGFRYIEFMDDLVDYWDLVIGGSDWGQDAASSRTHPENHEAQYTTGAKDHTDKPVINVGRFTNPDTMVEVIRSGQADIIATARPSISDPFLPKKIEEGRLDEIRECIGCNMCVSRYEQCGQIVCTQNATTGEEFRRGWHPERFTPALNRDNDVLVVGAGPAGMECAMVLGKREMRRVHLVDAEPEMGGSARRAAKLPGRSEWARVINYRQIQLDKLKNVSFIPKTRLDADGVLDYGAEIVVVATGSHWDTSGAGYAAQGGLAISDAARSHVLSPEQILDEGVEPGERVLVYDADLYYMGSGLAEMFAAAGRQVTLVTPAREPASYTRFTLEQARVVSDLRELGVRMVVEAGVDRVEDGSMHVATGPNQDRQEVAFDTLVMVSQRLSDDDIYQQLRRRPDDFEEVGISGLYRIGDSVAPTFMADAIFDGHRLAREIDSPDPSRPLPFIRERRVAQGDESSYLLAEVNALA